MLDIGWTELLVIAIVLIVVVGPKDLPPMLRAFGKMTSNLRKMAGEFRSQFDEALRESDLDDVRRTISDAQRLNPTNALREAINPLRQMGQEIKADLQRSTQVPTASPTAGAVQDGTSDVEAQQAIEGAATDLRADQEVPTKIDPVTAAPVTPVAASPVAPVAASPVAPAAPASAPPEPAAPAVEKAKRVRKIAAAGQPAEPIGTGTASEPVVKPKRSRASSVSSPVAAPVGEVVAAAPDASKPRRRVVKKTETPKDDA
jgi:sec-independent protein translocase protein TatB